MMVGRFQEIAELSALFADCAQGTGRAILISGPLACGKTELLHAFAEEMAKEDALLLQATASEAEQSLPWAVMSQLLDSVDRPHPALDAEVSAVVVHGVCRAILELSHERPVVVSIDDVQHIDRPSLLTLLSLLRRIRVHRVLVVMSTGTQHWQAGLNAWTELLSQPYIKKLHLTLLTEGAVGELLSVRHGEAAARAHAAGIHAATGGSPLLVRALLEDLSNSPAHADCGDVPHAVAVPMGGWAFQLAVLACLHRGDRSLFEMATGVAVLGESSTEAVRLLMATDIEDVTRCLDVLEQAGLLRNGRFRHPAARRAVLDALDPTERARLHLRAAELLRESGAGSPEIAEHLILSGPARWEWEITVLLEAAEQALKMDRIDHAADCLRMALSECADGQREASITAKLCRADWRLNPSAIVRHLGTLRHAAAQGLLSSAELVQLIRYLSWHGQTEAVAETLTRFGSRVGAGDLEWLPELCSIYQWLHCSNETLSQLPSVVRGSRQKAGIAPSFPNANALSLVLSQGGSEETVRIAEQVLKSSLVDDHTVEAAISAMLALAYADQVDRAAAWGDVLLAEAITRKAPTWQAQMAAVRADLALRQGDLPLAVECSRQALDLLPRQSWGVVVGDPLASLLLALVWMGRNEEAEEELRFCVPEAMFNTRFGAQYLYARGRYYRATGRAHAAWADFQRCGHLMVQRRIDLPAFISWRSAMAEAYLDLDTCETARDLVTEQLDRLGQGNSRVRGISLRVLARAGELRRRPTLLREAVDLLQSCNDRVEMAAALADLSNAYHELGEFSRAHMMARRVQQVTKKIHAEAVSATLLPTHLPSDSAGAGLKAEGLALLSDAERRVASLAAVGHTNLEISRRLFITVSTVEQHLTRAYRKLKVTRRADLPVILHLDVVESA